MRRFEAVLGRGSFGEEEDLGKEYSNTPIGM